MLYACHCSSCHRRIHSVTRAVPPKSLDHVKNPANGASRPFISSRLLSAKIRVRKSRKSRRRGREGEDGRGQDGEEEGGREVGEKGWDRGIRERTNLKGKKEEREQEKRKMLSSYHLIGCSRAPPVPSKTNCIHGSFINVWRLSETCFEGKCAYV